MHFIAIKIKLLIDDNLQNKTMNKNNNEESVAYCADFSLYFTGAEFIFVLYCSKVQLSVTALPLGAGP